MRKGTFSVQKAGANSAAHNSREKPPKYLIGFEPDTENYYELIQSDQDFILEAQQIYKDKIGQSMQKKQIPNLVQETVLTLQKNQNENDVKKLFEKLHDKFGGHTLLELSVHRDEGHFEKDDIAYYPTKNILKKENTWHIQSDPNSKEFDIKVDINEFEKVYNYHAHAKFSMFDKELGKSARMQKKDMSERIKFVSDELGLKFAPNEATRHISKPIHQIKDEHHIKAKEQIQEQYSFRQTQQRITSLETDNAALKKELHSLNSSIKNTQDLELKEAKIGELEAKLQDIKAKVETKDLTIEELQNRKNTLSDALKAILPTAQKSVEVVEYVKTLKNELQDKKALKATVDTLEGEKIVLKQDMSVLKQDKKTLNDALITKTEELQKFEEVVPQEKRSIFKTAFQNVMGYVKDLVEQVKTQAQEILSLKTQVQQLKLENQKYKSLVSSKVAELVPNEDELTKFKRELPKKLFNTSANDLRKELSGSYDELKDQKIKIIDEHISKQVQAMLKNSNAVTLEDLRATDRANQKTQSNQQSLSR
jgi:hypothetical protein